MSDTPRTDERIEIYHHMPGVNPDFARQLERENNQLHKQLESWPEFAQLRKDLKELAEMNCDLSKRLTQSEQDWRGMATTKCNLEHRLNQLRKELGERKSKELEMYELMKHRMDQRDESEQREKQWRKMADRLASIPIAQSSLSIEALAAYHQLKGDKP